jgi:hypothetical protein
MVVRDIKFEIGPDVLLDASTCLRLMLNICLLLELYMHEIITIY